jgi:hypothetical protein
LQKDLNPGLEADAVVSPITSTNVIRIAQVGSTFDPKQVKLTFTLPAGAKLMRKGVEVKSNTTALDLSESILLVATAANGNTQLYTVGLELPQTVEWTLAKTAYTYGDAAAPIDAQSSAGLPLAFTSTDGKVATVAGGKLVIGIPGKTTLSARQLCGGAFARATEKSYEIAVNRGYASVGMVLDSVEFGQPTPWEWGYANIVNPTDIHSMPDPLELGVFQLLDAHGEEVNPHGVLPIGTYSLEPKNRNGYQTPYYTVTPVASEFSVVQGRLWQVAFSVVDSEGQPLSNVAVLQGDTRVYTDAQGMAYFYLKAGFVYAFTLGKEGYQTLQQEVNLTTGINVTRAVTLGRADITLAYTAKGNGRILGKTTQRVTQGGSGTTVWAIPNAGYRFTQWSDGKTDNPRLDTQMVADLAVEAQFSILTYTLTYRVGDGGVLESGETTQTVNHGTHGTPIKVKPVDADHYFMGWSDGNDQAERTDTNVKAGINATALFGIYRELPNHNDFEAGTLVEGWYMLGNGDASASWRIADRIPNSTARLDGHFAYAQSKKLTGETLLCSPIFRLNGITSDIRVKSD